jgi:hypothetical protein
MSFCIIVSKIGDYFLLFKKNVYCVLVNVEVLNRILNTKKIKHIYLNGYIC